nr:jerky protein homolog-like [Megalopta genalis]
MQNQKRGRGYVSALSIEQKRVIVQKLDCGISVSRIAYEYNIHPSTVRKIRKKGLPEYQGPDVQKRKRVRRPMYEDLDAQLYSWYRDTRTLGIPITNSLLQKKALQISKDTSCSSTFKASHGWLEKFKIRHNIRLLSDFNEEESTDASSVEKFIEEFHKKIEEEKLQWNNIYNMNGSKLGWKFLPTKILAESARLRSEGKKTQNEVVNVGLCSNATGLHKLKPLVISKLKNPRVLKSFKDDMPVVFKFHKRCWMDQTVFLDWYENDFKPAVKHYQSQNGLQEKVILLLDNYRGIKLMEECHRDKQFEIVILPLNTTALLQPMDQGIIAKMKKSFCLKMLLKMTEYNGGLSEFYSNYSIKDYVEIIGESWAEINARILRNSWNNITKSSEEITMEEHLDEEDEQINELVAMLTGHDECLDNDTTVITEAEVQFSEVEAIDCQEVYSEEQEQIQQDAIVQEEEEEEEEQIGEAEEENKWSDDLEIAKAFEVLYRHTEGKPKYVRTLLMSVKQAFVEEETPRYRRNIYI